MKCKPRFATLALLAAVPLAAIGVEPSGSPSGPGASDGGRPPSSTQTTPTQPYGPGTPTSPGSATTTDGSIGPGGTMPPGTSPRDDRTSTGRPADMPPLFKELDTNKDGYITRDEAKRSADTTARFDEIDTDHDGRISVLEWKTAEDRKLGR